MYLIIDSLSSWVVVVGNGMSKGVWWWGEWLGGLMLILRVKRMIVMLMDFGVRV